MRFLVVLICVGIIGLAAGVLGQTNTGPFGFPADSGTNPMQQQQGMQTNLPNQQMGPQNSGNSGGMGFGGSSFDFRMGFGNEFEDGLNADYYVKALITANLFKGLAYYRKDIQANCLAEGGIETNVSLLSDYYQENSSLVNQVCTNRKEEASRCKTADYCSTGFGTYFLQGAPPEVRKAISNMGLDKDDLEARLKTGSGARELVKQMCLSMAGEQAKKQETQMDKEIERQATQFQKLCEQNKQWEEQRKQQESQWQNQGNQQTPYGPQYGPGPNQGSGQQQPNCPNGGYWQNNQFICNSQGQPGYNQPPQEPQPYCGDHMCNNNETPDSCASDCAGGGNNPPGPMCGNNQCEGPSDCPSDCSETGNPPQGPACGNGVCEGSSDCPSDCEGGSPPGPVCGDGTCNEDAASCPADCPGGNLVSDVLNRSLSNGFFPISGLVNLLNLQQSESDSGGNSFPFGFGSGTNCPMGEYPDPNNPGNCIRTDPAYGGGFGIGGPGMTPNQGGYGQGGYNTGPQMGGPNMGPNLPGVGPFNPSNEEDCALSLEQIKEQLKENYGLATDVSEQMTQMCAQEAERRGEEISMMVEQISVQKEFCEAEQATRCAFKQDVADACDAVLAEGIRPLAQEMINFQCKIAQVKAQRQKAGQFSELAMQLMDVTSQAGGNAEVAGNSAALEIFNRETEVDKAKSQAGILSLILGDPELKKKYEDIQKTLSEKQQLVNSLESENQNSQDVASVKQELEKKMTEAQTCAEASGSLFGRLLSGC